MVVGDLDEVHLQSSWKLESCFALLITQQIQSTPQQIKLVILITPILQLHHPPSTQEFPPLPVSETISKDASIVFANDEDSPATNLSTLAHPSQQSTINHVNYAHNSVVDKTLHT